MFGFLALRSNPEKILVRLKEFELFCLGKKILSPEKFKELNEELSVSAVLNIGSRRYVSDIDGKHLLWKGLDNREHDLGPIHKLNIYRDYPGFHRTRTLSLGHNMVSENEIIDIPQMRRQATMVKLDDGIVGIGPNYKIALRNAALKRHLKRQFNKQNRMEVWAKFYGHA